MKKTVIIFAALCLALNSYAQNGPVKIWEGTINLPTYRVDPAEKAPMFARDFAYQRAKRAVYPYAMNDNPTYNRVDSTHRAVFLENDYLQVCVLPDIGGRLLYAHDKTDGYEIFYRQHVIKPANVGMLGSWISGGVEWNTFHHHRQTSQLPIDYKLVSNPDGSKTIWIGEVENRQRMHWSIGLTLHPDKSYIEVTGRLINSTADRNSMLYWSNVATHSNDNYQIIFPECTDFGVFHAKNSFLRWPVPDAPYCDNPNYIGKDVSWWKNMPAGGSVFIYDQQDDFVGGYDFGKDAGTMLVGDHNINKGGKFWTWGPKAYGRAWDQVTLTDSDGSYVELMTAAYSDNQPDYCWINPYEVKEFTNYWYGIRNLSHVNRGNQFATVNMDIKDGGNLHLAANVTQIRNNAKVVVRHADKVLYETTSYMAPDKPWAADVQVDASELSDPTSVTMTLYDADGKELISYHPYKHDADKPMPETVKPPRKPSEIENIEEVYYTGLRNLQFHNAHVDPNDYFYEVIKRDPLDTRANAQLGIYFRKNGDWDQAAKYLRTSLKRQTKDYTRVADGTAMYNLGLVLKAEGKYKDAIDTLYRAAWDYAYASPAYYQLAQISSICGDPSKALQQADMSVRYNGMNIEAKCLKATLLRVSGNNQEADTLVNDVLDFDPLNFYAMNEAVKLGIRTESDLKALLRDQSEAYIELALYYLNNGFKDEATSILLAADAIKPYPTVKYYLGYLTGSNDYFKDAEALPTDYVYPFRLETIPVLERALEVLPKSAVTYYYLGDLLYQIQPEKAMEAWAKALEINPDYALVLRNMGWGYRFFKNDYKTAIEYYEKAIAADKSGEDLFFAELDELYHLTGAPLQKRYDLFKSHPDVHFSRYDSHTAMLRQMVLNGDFEKAIEIYRTSFFQRREHIDDLHDAYVDACQLAGLKAWKDGDNEKALQYFTWGNEYPQMQFYAHLEDYARDAQVYYLLGLANEKLGKSDEAKSWYEKAAAIDIRDTPYIYEKGLALMKLGKQDDKSLYTALIEKGKAGVTKYVERFFESFDYGMYPEDANTIAYYNQGIGYKALGQNGKANSCFRQALKERNDNLWALYYTGYYE